MLLQKLCKNCPRPEKPFSNSKTISLYITYKNSRFNNQKFVILSIKYECALKNSSNHRTAIRKWSLVICKGFFCMTTLWFDKFFNSVMEFVMKTSRLSLKWLRRLQILIQSSHSDLELLFFIKKHSFITIVVKFTSEHVKLLKFSTQPVLNLKKDNFVRDSFVVMYY